MTTPRMQMGQRINQYGCSRGCCDAAWAAAAPAPTTGNSSGMGKPKPAPISRPKTVRYVQSPSTQLLASRRGRKGIIPRQRSATTGANGELFLLQGERVAQPREGGHLTRNARGRKHSGFTVEFVVKGLLCSRI